MEVSKSCVGTILGKAVKRWLSSSAASRKMVEYKSKVVLAPMVSELDCVRASGFPANSRCV